MEDTGVDREHDVQNGVDSLVAQFHDGDLVTFFHCV